jgi:hypothetical protein
MPLCMVADKIGTLQITEAAADGFLDVWYLEYYIFKGGVSIGQYSAWTAVVDSTQRSLADSSYGYELEKVDSTIVYEYPLYSSTNT